MNILRVHVENKDGTHHSGLFQDCQPCAINHPVITLVCCCCHAPARGRQWHNRDTGYGLCAKCAQWIATRETPETMLSNYGHPNINYFTQEN